MAGKLLTVGFLPERYKERFRRRVLDGDTSRGFLPFEDEWWDGHQDATVRPFPVRAKLGITQDEPKVELNPLRDRLDTALANLRRISALDREKQLASAHRRVFRVWER